MKKLRLLFWFFLLPVILVAASCQSFNTNNSENQNSKPPWMTPATWTPSLQSTRTLLVIPERTAIPFQKVIFSDGFAERPHYNLTDPAIVVLTEKGQLSMIEDTMFVFPLREIEKVDFDENIVIVVYHGYLTSGGISPEIKMVYKMDDHIQVHAFFRTPAPGGDSPDSDISPFAVIRIKKEDLPDHATFDLVVKSEVLQSVDAVIQGN
jgi:hypothetical protein